MGDKLMRMKGLPLLHHPLGHEIGISIHFGQIVIDVSKWILQRRSLEIPDRSIYIEAFMDQFITVAQAVLTKQLGLTVIGIPAAVANPAPEKVIFARHEIGVGCLG